MKNGLKLLFQWQSFLFPVFGGFSFLVPAKILVREQVKKL